MAGDGKNVREGRRGRQDAGKDRGGCRSGGLAGTGKRRRPVGRQGAGKGSRPAGRTGVQGGRRARGLVGAGTRTAGQLAALVLAGIMVWAVSGGGTLFAGVESEGRSLATGEAPVVMKAELLGCDGATEVTGGNETGGAAPGEQAAGNSPVVMTTAGAASNERVGQEQRQVAAVSEVGDSAIVMATANTDSGDRQRQTSEENGDSEQGTEMVPLPEAPQVSAQTAAVIELTTGRVLYEKNAEAKAYPASTTKILTALLAFEQGDMNRRVKISKQAAGVEGSSIYLEAGESVRLLDLIYGLMLRSGNDAAVAIAETVSGDAARFARLMNERAAEAGAFRSHFVNPNGLYDEEHYTTALDMVMIDRAAMLTPEFRQVAAAKSWQAQRAPDKYSYFTNKNKVVYEYEGGTGVKIGYTTATGRTLVASSKRGDMEVICAVMNAPDWFEDSYRLMDYAYHCFEMKELTAGERGMKRVPVRGGSGDTALIGAKLAVRCPLKKDGSEAAVFVYEGPAQLKAPVKRWQEYGYINVIIEGKPIFSQKLYCMEDIGRQSK